MAESSTEYQLAAKLGAAIADNLFGAAATQITDPILGALGLGGAPNYDAYFDQIQNQLKEIQVSLDELSQKVSAISAEIDKLSLAAIEITSELSDVELQNVLQHYTADANLIEQNFQSYSAILAAMAKPAQLRGAISELFELFQVNNLDAIATAMRNLHVASMDTERRRVSSPSKRMYVSRRSCNGLPIATTLCRRARIGLSMHPCGTL
jgi:hypothetical protein